MSEDNTQDSNQSHEAAAPENAHLAQIEDLKLQVDKFKNEYQIHSFFRIKSQLRCDLQIWNRPFYYG